MYKNRLKKNLNIIIEHMQPSVGCHIYRLNIIIFSFFIVFFSLISRLYDVSITNNEPENKNNYQVIDVTKRNNIIDRNGNILAVDLSVSSIYANPSKIIDIKEAAKKISEVLTDIKFESLYSQFRSGKKFIWIKRSATPKEVYQINKLGIPGIMFQNSNRRIYPHGNLLSHVLGYVGVDGKGLAGIEKYFDKDLISEKNSQNKEIELSIDLRLQYILHEELMNAYNDFSPVGAAGIVTDIETGEILAMVSLPDFDPHNPGKSKSEQMFNRASLASQELGSVFKVATIAAALDSNIISMKDNYNVTDPIKAARFTLHDYHAKGGVQSVPQIFINSSNIGTAKIALDLGTEIQKEYMKYYGLMDPINVEIPEKGTTIFPKSNRWSSLSTMTISYGHGMMLTPLHFIRAFGGMVNNGVMNDLTLIKNKTILSKRIIKQQTSDNIKKLLRLNITNGSGKKANAAGYLVGGKTGTAEKAINGVYSKRLNLSSFIAAFPINDPKYAVFVLMDEPKGNASTYGYSTGGWTAAPIVGNVIKRMGPVLNIKPVNEEDPDIKSNLEIPEFIEAKKNETL